VSSIRRLIAEVERLDQSDENRRRIDVQARLNRLEAVHPTPFNSFSLGGLFPIVVIGWSRRLNRPMDVEQVGKATGPLDSDYAARLVEFQLLQKTEAFRESGDDIPLNTAVGTNLGLCWLYRSSPVGERYQSDPQSGAFQAVPILETEQDLDRLTIPHYEYDQALHEQRVGVFQEILEGRLPVIDDGLPGGIGAPFQTANNLRGVQEILEDFLLRPHLVHRLMDYVSSAIVSYVGEAGAVRGGGTGTPSVFGCSGVFGCDEVNCDLFPPRYYEEFIYPYECRAAAVYDTIYYHSCANITPLFGKIATVPNMRRIHVSPWSDLRAAREATQGTVILEKWLDPNVNLNGISEEEMRRIAVEITDVGVDYPLDMRVETNTPGGKRFRDIFRKEAA